VAVAAVRRKASRIASGWSWRLAGLALCAFFGLGFLSGASGNRANPFFQRAVIVLKSYKEGLVQTATLVRDARRRHPQPASRAFPGEVALVQRHDGLYALRGSGELLGPLSAGATDNLPIVSGDALEDAGAEHMVEYASLMVRAEAVLSRLISEMYVHRDGEASLFLDSSHTEVALDLDNASAELERASDILGRWRGREDQIARLDMTVPGEAVVSLRATASGRAPGQTPAQKGHRRHEAVVAMTGGDGGGPTLR
jgi:hypothetical protein